MEYLEKTDEADENQHDGPIGGNDLETTVIDQFQLPQINTQTSTRANSGINAHVTSEDLYQLSKEHIFVTRDVAVRMERVT